MTDLTDHLPPVDPFPYRAQNRTFFQESQRTCVVIDDDPTGNQTVYGVPLLATWDYEVILHEFERAVPAFFLLTNSRSFPEEESRRIGLEIAQNLLRASKRTDRKFVLISRSDSTLRGHFPSEILALEPAMAMEQCVTFLVPSMFEGGRVTLNDTHYIKEGGSLVPVNQTPFAQDATFGYIHSNLKDWVQEKSLGILPASQVGSISIEDIRTLSLPDLVRLLKRLKNGTVCVVNVLEYADMDKFCSAVHQAQKEGREFLFRTSSSFIPSYIGLPTRGLLTRQDLRLDSGVGGLVVVGSYVPKSSQQLSYLIHECNNLDAIPVAVAEIVNDSIPSPEGVGQQVSHSITAGRHVVVYTSRELVTASDAGSNLRIGSKVSNYLVQIVRSLQVRPRFMVAKGGITSNDLAIKGLGMKKSVGLGQILPGVPVWEMGKETRFPGLPYIVFPGNVGGAEALTELVKKMD